MSQQGFQRPESKPGEWHDALWHQYMNCVDSLRAQSAESSTLPGLGPVFKSHPSFEGFEGNVRILMAMCSGYDLVDADFVKSHENTLATANFADLTRVLKAKKFWKEGQIYLGRI